MNQDYIRVPPHLIPWMTLGYYVPGALAGLLFALTDWELFRFWATLLLAIGVVTGWVIGSMVLADPRPLGGFLTVAIVPGAGMAGWYLGGWLDLGGMLVVGCIALLQVLYARSLVPGSTSPVFLLLLWSTTLGAVAAFNDRVGAPPVSILTVGAALLPLVVLGGILVAALRPKN